MSRGHEHRMCRKGKSLGTATLLTFTECLYVPVTVLGALTHSVLTSAVEMCAFNLIVRVRKLLTVEKKTKTE